MAKRARDYQAEYSRRQQRARERGFRGYAQERKARQEYRQDPEVRYRWQRAMTNVPSDLTGVYDSSSPEFGRWWSAHMDEKESQRRDRNSARAYWYVEVTGQVADYDTWVERYA